jgi:hypothetical protein
MSAKETFLENLKYRTLGEVLLSAFDQAAHGKGKERHADGKNFEDQPMIVLGKLYKSGPLFQAAKKMHEAQNMDTEAAIRELYGAINYIAGEIIIRSSH